MIESKVVLWYNVKKAWLISSSGGFVMIASITEKELALALAQETPRWSKEAIINEAKECLSSWDERLEPVVKKYIKEGVCSDFKHGEFSIFIIRALRQNCGFLKAVSLMDAYLKDSTHGKALILRRTGL